MSVFHDESLNIVLILPFILQLNSYSILFESLAFYSTDPYTGVLQNILLLSFAALFLVEWIILTDYIKIGFLYKALPWMGLVYMGTYELWHRKSAGSVSVGLGLLIAIYCCYLILFRLLNLPIGLLWQTSVQHPRYRQVDMSQVTQMTSNIQQQQQQQQQHWDDQCMEERSFISRLREGGIIPWSGVKLVIVFIVNGAVMMGTQKLVLEANGILSVAVAAVMLITGLLYFGLFWYDLEEAYGEVLPLPPLPPTI